MKKQPPTFKVLIAITLNLLLSATLITLAPHATTAQDSSNISQEIQGTDIIAVICAHDSFSLEPININSPDPNFKSYWINPKNPINYEANPVTCGSGITVRDERYNGGFELQVSATNYTKLGDPTKTITKENLAIITEQIDSSYYESTSTPTQFIDTGDTLLLNSQGDNVEVQYDLPFTFTYYGSSYTTIYACSNGSINFTPGNCTAPPTDLEDTFTESPARILPYYKDLTTADPAHGIWQYTDPAPTPTYVRFRWAAAPLDSPATETHFAITLTDNGSNDKIAFDYAPGTPAKQITDTGEPPIIGVTKGGTVLPGELSSSVYTESVYSKTSDTQNLEDKHINFHPSGFDFIEVKRPGTPAALANYNGNPIDDSAYVSFTGPGQLILIDGTAAYTPPPTTPTEGRVGLYTVYPSFRLTVPNTTEDGTYQSEITYDLVI